MCLKCKKALDKYWPNITDEQKISVLWATTAYPFADADYTIKQIKDMAERSHGDVGLAYKLADEDMDRAMEHGRMVQINTSWPPGRDYYSNSGYRNPAWCT